MVESRVGVESFQGSLSTRHVDGTPAADGTAERDLVGVLEVSTVRNATRDA
jgi:hypothetical protein